MRNFLFLLLILFVFGCKKSNQEQKFTKKIYNLTNPIEKSEFEHWVKNNIIDNPIDSISLRYNSSKHFQTKDINLGSCMFEDKNFEAYMGCAGEFGGYVVFRDKQTSKFYYVECICLKMIENRDGNYFITESLAHGSGFARIQKISDPRKLVEINIDSINKDWKTKRFPNLDRYKIYLHLQNQGTMLLDTGNIMLNNYFHYKDKDYAIFSNDTTYLAEIKNKKCVVIDTLLPLGIWSSFDYPNNIISGIQTSSFRHTQSNEEKILDQIEGQLFIKKDTIVLGYKGFRDR